MTVKLDNVVVVGLGTSGLATARACLNRGARVTLTDSKPREAFGDRLEALVRDGAMLALGGHDGVDWASATTVVVSPGVPSFPALDLASQRGADVIGEVEFAWRLALEKNPDALTIAVGGTNGKSTVTTLVGELMKSSGKRVFVGGNLGEPLAAHLDEPWDFLVLEVSSFQMERAPTFHPTATALLNVTDDHLDRYSSFLAYAEAKGNAFVNQDGDDVAVVPVGDALCLSQAHRGKGEIVTFGEGGDLAVLSHAIVDRASGAEYLRSEMKLSGGHNAANVAAAIALTRRWIAPPAIRAVLASFRGLPHRTAFVAEIDGVRYYDDSKGTNVGASVTALLGLGEPKAVLIAGGRDKLGSYEPLAEALRKKGRAVVLIGEAADVMAKAFSGTVPIERARDMAHAVALSRRLAQKGDAVLLSPACSSFDMFRDYKHRGEEFVRSVEEQVTRGR